MSAHSFIPFLFRFSFRCIVLTGSNGTVSGLGPCFGDDGACNGANGGGTCTSDYYGVYEYCGYCECNVGFSGTHCQTGVPAGVPLIGLSTPNCSYFFATWLVQQCPSLFFSQHGVHFFVGFHYLLPTTHLSLDNCNAISSKGFAIYPQRKEHKI